MDPDDHTTPRPCRLCLDPVDATGIWIYDEAIIPPDRPADIIQQHFGVHVYKTDTNSIVPLSTESEYVCATCWAITAQFNRLHVFVRKQQAELERYTVADETKAEMDDEQHDDATMQQTSIAHLKVEVMITEGSNDEDDGADEHVDDNDAAMAATAAPVTPKPQRPRKPDRKPPVKHSPADIQLQDRHIREYFQMHCDHCSQRFEVLRDAIEHYRSEHGRRGYLKCCGKRFFNRTMMLDHLRQHSDPRAFLCAPCDRTYCSQAALDLHLATHDQLAERPFVCVVCGVAFLKQFQMRNHQRAKHYVSSGKEYGCDICGNW